jgi:DNA-directed RNA polymerase specialized sigma24 family protein
MTPRDEARYTDLVDNYLKELRAGREPDRAAILSSVSEESRPEVKEQLEAAWALHKWQRLLTPVQRREWKDKTAVSTPRDFEDAVEKQRPVLLKIVRARVGVEDAAEDILLDALIRARARFQQARVTVAQLPGWLKRYVQLWVRDCSLRCRNESSSAEPLRSCARQFTVFCSMPFAAATLNESVTANAAEDRLVQSLKMLPATERALVCLRFWDGLALTSTANRLGMSMPKVQKCFVQALAEFAQAAGRTGIQPAGTGKKAKPKPASKSKSKADVPLRIMLKAGKKSQAAEPDMTGMPYGKTAFEALDKLIKVRLSGNWTAFSKWLTTYAVADDESSLLKAYELSLAPIVEFKRFREQWPNVNIKKLVGVSK